MNGTLFFFQTSQKHISSATHILISPVFPISHLYLTTSSSQLDTKRSHTTLRIHDRPKLRTIARYLLNKENAPT